MTDLFLDTETFSTLDLKQVGTYCYAENAEVMLIQWAIDDGPVHVWDYNDGTPPPDFARYVAENPDVVVIAANAMFDRNVLRLGNLHVDTPIERWRCTMVQAYQHALPGSLDELGRVLGLPIDKQKDKRGKQLIQRFCKPAPSNHNADRYTRATHPAEWAEFVEYGVQDIITLRESYRQLPRWNWTEEEIALWHLDQHTNDRGFCVDRELVNAGARAATNEKQRLADRFAELTDGLKPSQRAQVQAFLNDKFSLGLDSTAKHIMEPLSKDPMQCADVHEISSIILSANKTSTAKYASLAQAVSADGRFRGGLQFAGASRTRRWAGRVFQPQNLPSRGLPPEDLIDAYIDALKAGYHEYFFL